MSDRRPCWELQSDQRTIRSLQACQSQGLEAGKHRLTQSHADFQLLEVLQFLVAVEQPYAWSTSIAEARAEASVTRRVANSGAAKSTAIDFTVMTRALTTGWPLRATLSSH